MCILCDVVKGTKKRITSNNMTEREKRKCVVLMMMMMKLYMRSKGKSMDTDEWMWVVVVENVGNEVVRADKIAVITGDTFIIPWSPWAPNQ